QVADQRVLMAAFQTRVATVRGEIMTWKALHARMWEELEPDTSSSATTAAAEPTPAARSSGDPWGELDLLATSVAEEGPRLQDLEHVINRTGQLMSTLPLRWPLRGPIKSEFG